ncbi:hypothetical protein ACSHXN_21150 [Streptomyces sp. HUAS TT11]|uniref:hypothetical protein n=1 Tax=Streptomyces sp. HUAS TT11 TaxID=3447508 RepID=UPI003F65E0CC
MTAASRPYHRCGPAGGWYADFEAELPGLRGLLGRGQGGSGYALAVTDGEGKIVMAMGASLPGREWMIRDAKGRKYSYDSEEEAFRELSDFGQGATVWTRDVYRILFFTRSMEGWKQVPHPRG